MINDYPPKPADYYMNLDEITSLCDSITSIINEKDDYRMYLTNAETISSKGAMEVDQLSIEDPIRLLKMDVISSKANLSSAVSDLKAEANSLYDSLNQRYQDYLLELERQRQREKENQEGEE